MSGLFMDYPDWTPEQRFAITRLELLRMQRVVEQITASLPATEPSPLEGGVSPGAVVAGASHTEPHA